MVSPKLLFPSPHKQNRKNFWQAEVMYTELGKPELYNREIFAIILKFTKEKK